MADAAVIRKFHVSKTVEDVLHADIEVSEKDLNEMTEFLHGQGALFANLTDESKDEVVFEIANEEDAWRWLGDGDGGGYTVTEETES
jgi:hypothetical protein